jgi:hypothetical protein
VDPVTFAERGEDALQLLHADMLWTLDALRDKYGPMRVNNWHKTPSVSPAQLLDPAWRSKNGIFIYRGFRPAACLEGTKYSQHRLGAAFDCDFERTTPEQVRQDIKRNPSDTAFTMIRAVEAGTSWLHFDGRNIPEAKQIMWVSP